MEASGELSADEWKLVAEHRSKSGQGNGGNTPLPTERVSESNGIHIPATGEAGAAGEAARTDRFGFTDEFFDVRERFGAIVDADSDFDVADRPWKSDELNVKGFRG